MVYLSMHYNMSWFSLAYLHSLLDHPRVSLVLLASSDVSSISSRGEPFFLDVVLITCGSFSGLLRNSHIQQERNIWVSPKTILLASAPSRFKNTSNVLSLVNFVLNLDLIIFRDFVKLYENSVWWKLIIYFHLWK